MSPESGTSTGSVASIVVAAGTGSRFGGNVPKQFVEVAGRRVVDWSIAVARRVSDAVVVVVPDESAGVDLVPEGVEEVTVVAGGASRSESVRAGLEALPCDAAIVLVHDAARPAASPELFERVIAAVRVGADGAVPVVPVVDTLVHVDAIEIDRADLSAVQTPQGFSAALLRAAHATGGDATDDATLVRRAGGTVVTVPGDRWNVKLTEPTDLVVLAALLGQAS